MQSNLSTLTILSRICHMCLLILWTVMSAMEVEAALTANNVTMANEMPQKTCAWSSECGDFSLICLNGMCACQMGYPWNATSERCQVKSCSFNNECYSQYSNTRCSANRICVCNENYELDWSSQQCKFHFASTLTEPYFYGPFFCLVAILILLLSFWYYCCRRQKHTTIIFHKGELPAAFISNTVATDHTTTRPQSGGVNTPTSESLPPSYTPFDTHMAYTNHAYQAVHANGHLNDGHPHEIVINSVHYVRSSSNPPIGDSNHLNHIELQTMRRDSEAPPYIEPKYDNETSMSYPPPPPPPPPPYIPLSSKVQLL